MQLRREPLPLETRFAFRIAHGARPTRVNTLVRIEHAGITGLGEAAPAPYYGETTATTDAALDAFAHDLGDDPFALDAIAQRMDARPQGASAARAAIEMALYDWIGKSLGQPVWRLLGLDRSRMPHSCVTLGLAEPDEMLAKLATVRDFPSVKVKLGAPGDVANLRVIRAHYDGAIQVDANAAWSRDDAVRVLREIEPLRIELCEQPVAREDIEGLGYVRARTGIPIYADESAHHLTDIPRLAGHVDGVTLKLMKTGGLREMQRMIHAARAHGMRVMLGCMVETSLALSAAAQLGPLADVLDLDGHWLLAHDPFAGAPGERGTLTLSDAPGLGVTPAEVTA